MPGRALKRHSVIRKLFHYLEAIHAREGIEPARFARVSRRKVEAIHAREGIETVAGYLESFRDLKKQYMPGRALKLSHQVRLFQPVVEAIHAREGIETTRLEKIRFQTMEAIHAREGIETQVPEPPSPRRL